ncbi:MAG: hypothetical protein AB7P02_02215 [Alphaproteobacteria bacterium]
MAAWGFGTAVVALVLAATSPLWGPALVGGEPLAGRIAAAEREVARVGKVAVERTEPLAARIATVESDLQRGARAGEMRLDELRRLALVGAIAQLRPALVRPTPFPLEFAAVKGLAAGRPDLAPAVALLEPHAAVGIPTARQLRARFDEYALRALMAEAATDDVPIVSQAVAWIASTAPLGSGRFVLDLAMPGAAPAVHAAGARLEAEDLEGALAALTGLRGKAADAMQPWIVQARARADARTAMDALTRAALLPQR